MPVTLCFFKMLFLELMCPKEYPFVYKNGTMCCKTVKNLRNGCMEKHREIYEGLRPLKSTCCEDSDSQPCPNKILYVDNVDLDADFRCVDNNESK